VGWGRLGKARPTHLDNPSRTEQAAPPLSLGELTEWSEGVSWSVTQRGQVLHDS
jgi:hypothetical protein